MVTTCGNCQHPYAANREACPKCGTKNPTPITLKGTGKQRQQAPIDPQIREAVLLGALQQIARLSHWEAATLAQDALDSLAPGSPLGLRPKVLAFALAMERKLQENDHRDGWEDESQSWLLGRMEQESEELKLAVSAHTSRFHPHLDLDTRGSDMVDTRIAVLSEAADVANFAMMVADVSGALDISS